MKQRKKSRAEQLGIDQGKLILENADMMYNNKTASNYLKGILETIFPIYTERVRKILDKKNDH